MSDASRTSKTPEVTRIGDGKVVLSTRALSFWYGDVIGINDISLDLGSGVIGLLGPNGAGKSTLLKCLCGQLQPDTGLVTLQGKPVRSHPSVLSEVGVVPEQDAFYEEMSGHQFVTALTRLHGFSKSDAADLADQALRTVSLSDEAHRPIKGYSKGMRQRVKIAQALAHQPSVLILDEPLAGTDPLGRRRIIDLITGLGDEGRTLLVSSHVLHEVESMTSNIILINRGQVLADGNRHRIRELIDEHPHRIHIACDTPRKLAASLIEFDDIRDVSFTDEGLTLSTDAPSDCYQRIPRIALDEDIELLGWHSDDNDLSTLFRYLVS